jgi:ketosteroid isomerase-like protein
MTEHPNVALFREHAEVFNRGDLEEYRRFFSDDLVWHVGGQHPMSGDYHGLEAAFAYFERIRQLTGGTLRSEPQDILADDTHVGVFTRVTAERDGRQLDVVLAQAFRVDAGGRFTEYWALANDQDAVDAFWA